MLKNVRMVGAKVYGALCGQKASRPRGTVIMYNLILYNGSGCSGVHRGVHSWGLIGAKQQPLR